MNEYQRMLWRGGACPEFSTEIITPRPSIEAMLRDMPAKWRGYWCEPGLGCACLGCANISGGLARHGYTKADWIASAKPPAHS